MDLKECQAAVEKGIAGQEHAEWLEEAIVWYEKDKMKWAKRAISRYCWASVWKRAAKQWREGCLAILNVGFVQKAMRLKRQRDEARDWAIRMMLGRDKLQEELKAQQDFNAKNVQEWDKWTASHYVPLKAENERLKAELSDESGDPELMYVPMPPGKSIKGRFVPDDERRCETCRSDMSHSWMCGMNVRRPDNRPGGLPEARANFSCSEWEAKDAESKQA